MEWRKFDNECIQELSEEGSWWFMCEEYPKGWDYSIVKRKEGAWYFDSFWAIDKFEDLKKHFSHFCKIDKPKDK